MADLTWYESIIVYEYYELARGFTLTDETVTVSDVVSSMRVGYLLYDTVTISDVAMRSQFCIDNISVSDYRALNLGLLRSETYTISDDALHTVGLSESDLSVITEDTRYWIDQCVFVETISVSEYVDLEAYLGSILRPPTGDIPVYPSQEGEIVPLTEYPFDSISITDEQYYAVTYYLYEIITASDYIPSVTELQLSEYDTITVSDEATVPQQGGSWCWGHDTGIFEMNSRDILSGYGSAIVSGTGDSEFLQFEDMDDYMLDPVYTGPISSGYIQLNQYSGQGYDLDGLYMSYRTGATQAECTSAPWISLLQKQKFDSLGWVQIYFVAGRLLMDTIDAQDTMLVGIGEILDDPIYSSDYRAVNTGMLCEDLTVVSDGLIRGHGYLLEETRLIQEAVILGRGFVLSETQGILDVGQYSSGGVQFAGQPVTFGGQPVTWGG